MNDKKRESSAERIMVALYDHGMFRTWYRDQPRGWTLVSGQWSPIYLQLRELCSYPTVLSDIGTALANLLDDDQRQRRLVGVAFGGIPIAIATSIHSGIPSLMTRKIAARSETEARQEIEQYGQHASVEGEMSHGDHLVIVDDLVTRFDSKLIAAQQVEYDIERRSLADVTCRNVLVVVDREQGASATASERGFTLQSLIRLKSEGMELLRPRLSPLEFEILCSYLDDPSAFQAVDVQRKLEADASRRLR